MTKAKIRNKKKKDCGIVDFMMIQKHFFKELSVWINEMTDPRNLAYTKYTQSDYIFMGILKNACGVESMCQMDESFNEETCIETLRILSGDKALDEMPHADSLNYYLERLSPSCLAELRKRMIKSLLRNKSFYKNRLLGKYWRVILDGTGLFYFKEYKTLKYYYYSNDDLAAMTEKELKEAKKHLTNDMELDEGIDFHPSMREDAAKELLEFEIHQMEGRMDNEYVLTEDNIGDRTDLSIDPEYAGGKTFVLDKSLSWKTNDDGSWPDMAVDDPALYSLAYQVDITNNYKRASVKVVKVDKYSSDKKPHGEADLNGAEFMLYEDQGCTRVAMVYDANGNPKDGGVYTVTNGSFSTDYLKSGVTYYLKETKSPKGYTLSNDVIPITSDTSGATAEYTSDLATVEYGNQPVLGNVAVQKYYSDGGSGDLKPEANTTFQVYLTSKGSYDACDDYERAVIKTDANGYGATKDLYIGKYTVHQVDSGDVDAMPVKDFNVEVRTERLTHIH